MIWGSISKTANIFWNFLGSTYWLQSIRKNDSRNFCLFANFCFFGQYATNIRRQIFLFYKSRWGKSSLEIKLWSRVRVDTIHKDHIYHTKQYQIFHGKIKCELLNLEGHKMGTIKIPWKIPLGYLQYLMPYIHFFFFFHKVATVM